MRTVFFGATDLGYRCCEALLADGAEIVGIFSIPPEFPISYAAHPVKNVTYRPFEPLAERFGIPIEYVSTSRPQAYLPSLDRWRPEFGLAIGWFYMVGEEIRRRLPKGVAGVHASLLPRYRGGAPLVWAMINGETTTGVTLFYLDEGVDTGDVIAQSEITIGRDDTIRDVYDRATAASVDLVRRYVPRIAAGDAPRRPQDDRLATQFPQRNPEMGRIDWTRSPEEIRNFIRAQTRPYPGAFTVIGGRKVVIWDADVLDPEQPGPSAPEDTGSAHSPVQSGDTRPPATEDRR